MSIQASILTSLFRGGDGDRKQLSLEKLSEMERRMGLEGGRRH